MTDSQTARKLADMTDEGRFERLATAVLRACSPDYAALLHTGINADGKTVKAPVDGFAFVPGVTPPHMVAAHHTICARNDLPGKWLHDPATVKPRKGKPTAPPGDARKFLEIYTNEKTRHQSLKATLALTTNQEPTLELVSDVHAFSQATGITIDIWSRSRIAAFLDDDPTGQWLRKEHLGIDQIRMSRELLRDMSRQSVQLHRPAGSENWVPRDLDSMLTRHDGDVLFVAADSGFGKSIACIKQLEAHVQGGGFGLVLPHDAIAEALSLNQVIDIALHQLHPTLEIDAGSRIRSYLSAEMPLVLVVEDVNRSGRAPMLVEKLASWSLRNGKDQSAAEWRLFCPVWPQVLSGLADTARKSVEAKTIFAGSFSPEEGTRAVTQRYRSLKVPLSQSNALALSAAFGHDPLLIALHEPAASPEPDRVIPKFIEASLHRLVSERSEFAAGDYRDALLSLARAMLECRNLDPKWTEIKSWPEIDRDTLAALRHLVHHAEVLRLAGASIDQHLAFRHDRVRDWVLADAIALMLRSKPFDGSILSDPFYADIVGLALARHDVPIDSVAELRVCNPLALFHAIRHFRQPVTALHRCIVGAAKQFAADPALQSRAHNTFRWDAVRALSQIDSTVVLDVVNGFRDRGWVGNEARFRNGDISGGLALCANIEPGVQAAGHEELIAHVAARFGTNLLTRLGDVLRNKDLPRSLRVGAIRLAGHIAVPALENDLRVSWDMDVDRIHHLADYLWASAQCYGGDPLRLLGAVCDAWAALPDTPLVPNMPSPRSDLAADHIRWAFGRKPPLAAIPYFIERAQTPELQSQITYMLHGVDEPAAVEHVARVLAAGDERLQQTGGFWPFSMRASDVWNRRQTEGGRTMSPQSRSRLLELWQDHSSGKFLRSKALQLWSATKLSGDLDILRIIPGNDDLANEVLVQRLVRADQSAVPLLIEKIEAERAKTTHWWQFARYLWSDELTLALDRELTRRGLEVLPQWSLKEGYQSDWITSEVVTRLPRDKAEQLLTKHWHHLKWSHYFLKVALYVATPKLRDMVAAVMGTCPEPKEALKFLHSKFGIKLVGHPGITHFEQVDALVPYLEHLNEVDIWMLSDLCNERGWFEYRRDHLDHRCTNRWHSMYRSASAAQQSLET